MLAALATLLGAALQSATGFGFALVLGPALFATLEPDEALTTLLICGAALNLLVLFSERRRRSIRWRDLGELSLGVLPGLLIGVLILGAVTQATLQVAVGVAVLVAAALQVRPLPVASQPPRGPGRAIGSAVGLITGVLTTSTGTSGPPLVLWLDRLRATPAETRDSLTAAFLILNALGALFVLVPPDRPGVDAGLVALLLVLTLAGQLAGRLVFARLDPRAFRAVGLALVVAAGIASIAAGLAA